MLVRKLGATVGLALLVGLAPLAHASPPDQTWLPGLYDDADYDDVVIELTSTVGASNGSPASELDPVALVIETLRPGDPSSPEAHTLGVHHLRGPPLG